MKLGQFRKEDTEEGACVDQEMCGVILCVETGQNIQHNGGDGEEFAWRCELNAIVHLFPVCEQTSFALVWCLKGSALYSVQEQVHHQIMDNISEGPDKRYGEERDAEEHNVKNSGQQ